MTVKDVLIRYLKDCPSVDQASLPSHHEEDQASEFWSVHKPISIILNVDLPTKRSTMGRFALILASRAYAPASDLEREAIVKDMLNLHFNAVN